MLPPLRLHIRGRPGMFIGGANAYGLRHIVDDIVLEQLAAPGACPDQIRCTLAADGAYAVEVAGGVLASVEPGDFDPESDRYAGAAPGPFFSLAIASALSSRLDAEVVRDGTRWARAFAAGLPAGPEEVTACSAPPRLRVHYRPDPGLFPARADADFLALCGRAQEWAAFHPRVRFTIEDERDFLRRDYHYPDGLLSLAREVEHHWVGLGGYDAAWRCQATAEDGSAAGAVLIRRPRGAAVYSFVNGRRTTGGGSHVDGLRLGAAAAVTGPGTDDPAHPFRYANAAEPLSGPTVLLAVRLSDPRYAGATKDELEDERALVLVRRMIERADKVPVGGGD